MSPERASLFTLRKSRNVACEVLPGLSKSGNETVVAPCASRGAPSRHLGSPGIDDQVEPPAEQGSSRSAIPGFARLSHDGVKRAYVN